MLSIRLRRAGTTKKPHYRVVVADSRAWRDGRFVEVLGHYDPRKDPVVVKIDAERAQYWIGKGAQPSDTVRSLLKKQSEAAKARRRSNGMRELLEALARELVESPAACASRSGPRTGSCTSTSRSRPTTAGG
jgi:small subunit ribosomal protein S16